MIRPQTLKHAGFLPRRKIGPPRGAWIKVPRQYAREIERRIREDAAFDRSGTRGFAPHGSQGLDPRVLPWRGRGSLPCDPCDPKHLKKPNALHDARAGGSNAMPRNVRPAWIETSSDASPVTKGTGPTDRAHGRLRGAIYLREQGAVQKVANIDAGGRQDGTESFLDIRNDHPSRSWEIQNSGGKVIGRILPGQRIYIALTQ